VLFRSYVATNPFVAFSTLSPRFEYSESGAIFMAQVGTTFSCCGDYRVGVRLRLPVRSLLVFDPCGASDLTGATLDDVWQTRKESIDKNSAPSAMTNTVFAGRLDFLSALVSSVSFPYQGNPLVVYETATNPTTEMAGNAVDVTPVTNNQPIVEVIASSTGAIPTTERWGDYPANGTVPLAGDGSGVMSGSRGRFVHGTDYTSLSASTLAQSQLFVVPSVDSGTNEVVSGANQIMGAVQAAIPNLQSISDFYQQVGLNFCKSHRTGVGDLDFEFYAGRNWGCRGKWWTDVIFGIRCPTAKQTSCSTCTPSCYPVWMPTGNDKHLELRLGGAFGVDVRDWVKLFAHGSWSWALAHNERIATPFQGATVKNLGPCMNAKVKWGYWEGDVDASFFANDCCGLDVGYQLYYKSRDKIRLCTTTATDWAGRTGQALDVNVITRNTKQMGHKAKAGFFAIINDCEIDGGWSTTVGGYNMPRETDFYVRFGVSF
ncbi:MAG: hypothetical protein M1549_00780, partial [Candidatus Dependentiae bacterium]|nr:hypothetical protein [Candidatus Dependentiae bacterium]